MCFNRGIWSRTKILQGLGGVSDFWPRVYVLRLNCQWENCKLVGHIYLVYLLKFELFGAWFFKTRGLGVFGLGFKGLDLLFRV